MNPPTLSPKRCTVEGCDGKFRCKGFCNLHYTRFIKFGDPLVSLVERRRRSRQQESYLCNGVGYISLGKGRFAKVDPEDFDRINSARWLVVGAQGNDYPTYYLIINKKRYIFKMHHAVLRTKMDQIDHINGDRFDNRKQNLRPVINSQNHWNRRPARGKRFKGVSYERGKWRAGICKDGQRYNLGLFPSSTEAAKAYNAEAARLFGEFAFLNPIP